jgi:hypothetical protein
MTDYALSAFEPMCAGDKSRKLSLGHRLLLWIEARQRHKADRELSRVFAKSTINPEWRLAGR